MIRIHATGADVARVRFAPRPAPLQELNVALSMMCRGDGELLFGRWRRRALRALPPAVQPLGDLVPAAVAPSFLDVFSDDLAEGLESLRATPRELVRSEIERVYAARPRPAPAWLHDLHRGQTGAWDLLRRAQHAAFETLVRPVWSQVQDLHRAEFSRHALAVAEHGIGPALAALVPGTRWCESGWEIEAPVARDISLGGRGLVLLPTFHWTGGPLVSDLPGSPVAVTYPAGPGVPLSPPVAGADDDALAAVLGRTRVEMLFLLAQEHTTSGLARRLRVSNATVSAHAAALRGAGLITTVRAGRAVLHQRTALGSLLTGEGRRPQVRP
ncbi:winged helix-turn-helix transcriptional regulator [Streptomyces sp. NA02950]|uniref:ArsR/SmtB family transcription factor n=1 Tax=Streptomyces sp. NA02950 TaxID=2742137 RepID=UPI0015904E5F|nr:winged helix-turn-helix domain-containing protein [Streptomyces sp. NA02950]QKV96798.1 winged helix-turn-helix transcriptional regulator [Streptomyces sp. NA02950]